jgi:glucose-1-phosphate thymidylyltransferase
MKGVVPAAGEGTRMRPLTAEKPKGLVEVAGKPLLSHVFETLVDLDVRELVVIIGYRGEQIREYYGEEFAGVPVTYERQESRDGLADALLCVAPHIEDNFLFTNGDNVIRANTDAVVRRHRETGASVTTLVEEVSHERASEGAVFEFRNGSVSGIVEKPTDPPSTVIPRGFYAFSPKIVPACRLVTPGHTGEYELTAAIDLLVQAGRRLETVSLDGWCFNINTPAEVETVSDRLAHLSVRISETDSHCE